MDAPIQEVLVDENKKMRIGAWTSWTGFVNKTLRNPSRGVYANNAAAIAGGLRVGDVYNTATGELRVVV
jgi:hypothetical protein